MEAIIAQDIVVLILYFMDVKVITSKNYEIHPSLLDLREQYPVLSSLAFSEGKENSPFSTEVDDAFSALIRCRLIRYGPSPDYQNFELNRPAIEGLFKNHLRLTEVERQQLKEIADKLRPLWKRERAT